MWKTTVQDQERPIPKVSTMGSFLTMAFLFAMRMTPMASVTVTTMGRPSGMAATARLKQWQVHGV